MILIADSGSTKTDWRIIDSQGKISQATCGGINPYYQDYEIILSEVESIPPQIQGTISKIFFYGAGCSSDENIDKIKRVLSNVFPASDIEVHHDLLAAAHSLCGDEEGIACILGTGANSCHYNGKEIIDNVASLGYIIGDEGSGGYLGKILTSDYLRRSMPTYISDKFQKRFELSKDEFLRQIYIEEGGAKYLASFSKFIFQNIKEPYLYKLVYEAFGKFFEQNIMKYESYKNYPIHFTGSVAFYYSDILRRVANDKGVLVKNIVESPIAGLTLYHQKNNKV